MASNRSNQRFAKPVVKLLDPDPTFIRTMTIVVGCADGNHREVMLDSKLAKAVLGFIQHRQGGKVILGSQVLLTASASQEKREGDDTHPEIATLQPPL